YLRQGVLLERGEENDGDRASINKTQLSAFPVVLPPMTEQEVFADRAAAVDSITLQQSESLKKSEASVQALLARAFGHQDFD
ncbi:MAG: hypothetical protein JSR16_13520, partial [Proteobacteria bacterium]|nr:hypothetical protein [Pseudomonadota bacterium]